MVTRDREQRGHALAEAVVADPQGGGALPAPKREGREEEARVAVRVVLWEGAGAEEVQGVATGVVEGREEEEEEVPRSGKETVAAAVLPRPIPHPVG